MKPHERCMPTKCDCIKDYIEEHTEDDLTLMCAFRYALGRRSYVVPHMCTVLKEAKLLKPTKDLIIKEIEACIDYGMDMDKKEWLALRDELMS